MKVCPKCKGTSTIIINGEEWECDNCEYGIIFDGYEKQWNPFKKSEMSIKLLKESSDFEECFPELAFAMRFDQMNYNLPTLKCKRCKHEWIPRTEKKPEVCPECNSPYWDKPYTRPDKVNKN